MKSPSTVLVDAGNFVEIRNFEPWPKSEFIWDLMAECGYDVVTPGDRELVQGFGTIQALFDKHPQIEVVSANITDKAGALLWKPYTILDRDGTKVGVTGVTGGSPYAFNLTRGEQKVDEFSFLDSRDALREIVPELRKQVDVLVVLLHETPADARRIVDEIPGMDVVIVGHNPGYMFNPDRLGNTLLVRGGNKGQYLNVLELTLDASNAIVDYSGEGKPLGKSVNKHPEIDATTTKFVDERKVREDAQRRKDAVGQAIQEGTESFIGSNMCQRCHADEYSNWLGSAHANVLLTHPPSYPSGDGVDMTGVQCEHCHGLGTLHGTEGLVTKVSTDRCLNCHVDEGVTDLDFAKVIAEGGHH